jgi:hypothetical protein
VGSTKLLDFLTQNGNKSGALPSCTKPLSQLTQSLMGVPTDPNSPGMSKVASGSVTAMLTSLSAS